MPPSQPQITPVPDLADEGEDDLNNEPLKQAFEAANRMGENWGASHHNFRDPLVIQAVLNDIILLVRTNVQGGSRMQREIRGLFRAMDKKVVTLFERATEKYTSLEQSLVFLQGSITALGARMHSGKTYDPLDERDFKLALRDIEDLKAYKRRSLSKLKELEEDVDESTKKDALDPALAARIEGYSIRNEALTKENKALEEAVKTAEHRRYQDAVWIKRLAILSAIGTVAWFVREVVGHFWK
jgi:hypothetical protein